MAKRNTMLAVNFDELTTKIREAGGNVQKAADKAAKQTGAIIHDELIKQANAAHVSNDVTGAIREKTEKGNGVVSVSVGWDLSGYNPKNLSAGYKALFASYGTKPRKTKTGGQRVFINGRWVTLGTDRGAVAGSNFIKTAKKKAAPKAKKAQQQILDAALKDLKK